MRQRFISQKAFTLIELLVIIAIIGILAGFIIVSMSGASSSANDSRRKADINQLSKAIMIHKTNHPDALLPTSSGCNIGTDCPNEVMEALGSASVLRDPDSTRYYSYSSDGQDYVISSLLSTEDNYFFDSSTGTYSTSSSNPPIPGNGVCGIANNTNSYDIPTTGLCTIGEPSIVSGTGPWTWDCVGTTTVNCSANLAIDGVCGTSDGSNLYEAPSSNLCSVGTASDISGTGPWTWTCNGTVNDNCSANKKIDGGCGVNNNDYSYNISAYPGNDFCVSGSSVPEFPEFPAMNSAIQWGCSGVNDGISASCRAYRTNIMGEWKFDGLTQVGLPALSADLSDVWGVNNGSPSPSAPIVRDGANCRSGKCLDFNGVNNYVSFGNWFNYQVFSISMWVNPGTTQLVYANILDNGHSDKSFVVQQNANNLNSYYFATVNGADVCQAFFSLTANTWSHLVLIRDSSSIKAYVNGVLIDSETAHCNVPILYDGSQHLRLGMWAAMDRFWNGRMDEVKIYNGALTQEQVQQLYSSY
ncbi:hypothetical protein MNSC_09150 [Minisyncoccus archaeophilus]|uniref:LamG domain-containing protein n=1 Tax=Minisyncoccus archaeiphilus TaxID=3238481 RepID=UPI00399D2062